jgi:hypothetical protein
MENCVRVEMRSALRCQVPGGGQETGDAIRQTGRETADGIRWTVGRGGSSMMQSCIPYAVYRLLPSGSWLQTSDSKTPTRHYELSTAL